jgi:monothiol glutaredoxin
MPLNDRQRADLDKLVSSNNVVLFMKGNRQFPQCGFSATVVGILDKITSGYQTVNVLADPQVREGMKEYSKWPTFPQLYVGGDFVGGCDIVKEMYASGELQKLLGASDAAASVGSVGPGAGEGTPAPAAPRVTITDSAAKAFTEAAEGAGGDVLRLEIDPQFVCDLHFGPRGAGDLETTSAGVTLYVDRASAGRADGITIDFVSAANGMAFRIDNPNEPPRVKSITPKALKPLLDRGEAELFDVRPADERAKAAIASAKALDTGGQEYLQSLGREAAIVFHCHHGMRSRAAAEQLVRQGFRNVYNLEGGIEAWSRDVDPSVPRY